MHTISITVAADVQRAGEIAADLWDAGYPDVVCITVPTEAVLRAAMAAWDRDTPGYTGPLQPPFRLAEAEG